MVIKEANERKRILKLVVLSVNLEVETLSSLFIDVGRNGWLDDPHDLVTLFLNIVIE